MFEKSVELINTGIADELTAVHQYMYYHFHCDDQGYELLSTLFKRTAIEEMMHIERLADRILFLKGEVELKAAAEVKKIHTPKEMLEHVTQMEKDAVVMYNKFAIQATEGADSATRKLFESLVDDEERHFSQFDKELENLHKFGENYLALQSMERSKPQ